MRSAAQRWVYGSFAVLVMGCSGGGGGSSPIASLPLADIDPQSAPIIAGAVTKAAVDGSDLGEFAGFAGGGAVLRAPDSQIFAKIGTLQASQTQALRARALNGELQTPIPPEQQDCAVSGTVTISGDIANPLTLSANDTFTLVFAACDDGAGVVNGTYAMRITSFSGDLLSGSFVLGVSVALTGFQFTENEQTVTVNGDVSVSMTADASPTQTITVTASSLSISDGGSNHTLANYMAMQTVDQFTGAYTLDVSGTLSGSEFSGRVTFETTIELAGDGTGFAFAGEIRINGALSATIDVIVLDGALVRLEIDYDGDGAIDEIVDTSWAELLAQP